MNKENYIITKMLALLLSVSLCIRMLDSFIIKEDENDKEGGIHASYFLAETCYLVKKVHLVKEPGCKPKLITLTGCDGRCRSLVRLKFRKHAALKECRACFPSKISIKNINFECVDESKPCKKCKNIKVKMIEECNCKNLTC